MAPLLIAFYIVTIMVRPQDWFAPVLGWQLVTLGAILPTIFCFPTLLGRFPIVLKRIPQMKAAMAFFVGLLFSILSQGWLTGVWLVFQEFGRVLFFFLLVLTLIQSVSDFKILLWAVLFCIGWLAIHAILQHNIGYGFGHQEPLSRLHKDMGETRVWVQQAVAFGTFNDPNDLCTALVFAIPLFYVLFKTSNNPIQQMFALVGVGVTAYGAYCTNSRGGVIAAFGMVVSYVLTRVKGFRRYLSAAFAVTLVTVLAPSRFSGHLIGHDRAVLWGDGIAMFKDNPVFGVGYKAFGDLSSEHLQAHNTYIHTLAELGLVGYLPLFLIIYLTAIHLRRAIVAIKPISSQDALLLAGVYSSTIGYMTSLYFVSREYEHFFYLVMALAITAVIVYCDRYGLTNKVFGNIKKDVRNGLFWGLGSVVIFYFTVRIANLLG